MSENTKSAPAVVAPVVAAPAIVVRETVRSQIRFIEAKGFALDGLSAAEVMELQSEFFAEWQGSDTRRAERDAAKAEREAVAAARKAKADADKKARAIAERDRVLAKLAALDAATS